MISARLRSNLNHKSCAQISEVSQLLKRLKIFALAESLGGVESLVGGAQQEVPTFAQLKGPTTKKSA